MAWQFANWLEKRLNMELRAQKNKSFKDLETYCNIKTSFNGRPAQGIIDPSIGLTKAPYSPFGANNWIAPYINFFGRDNLFNQSFCHFLMNL